MKIKKLFVRILIAAALGLCAGIALEYYTSGSVFPVFLIIGMIAGIFVGLVAEVLHGALTIAREDLWKFKKTVLRILIATSIGLLAGIILEFAAAWEAFPLFFSLGILLGTTFGIIIEAVRYRRLMRKAFLEGKDLGLEKLPLSAADLIRQVIKKMRYREEVLFEVMAELTSHFEDDLKSCQTDVDKEKRARQLVDDFGDMKLLAVLLRRAKKRCRPLWRTIVARTFQVIGVLILCFIVYLIWFFTGKPVVSANYLVEFNRITKPTAHESLNAAPLYMKAVELNKEVSDDFLLFFAKNHQALINEKNQHLVEDIAEDVNELFSNRKSIDFQKEKQKVQKEVGKIFFGFLREKYKGFTDQERTLAQRWFQEHKDALEFILEGSQKPHCWHTYKSGSGDSDEMIEVLMPDLYEYRSLAITLGFRARLNAEKGWYEKAFDDLKACYRLGQHLKGDKLLVEQLVGMAIEGLSIHIVQNIVANYDIDSEILAHLQRSFEQIIADEDFSISFKAERLCLYDEIQRCFTVDRFGRGHIYLPGLKRIKDIKGSYAAEYSEIIIEVFSTTSLILNHPNKEETLKTANELYDYYEKLRLKSAFQIHAQDQAVDSYELVKGNFFLEVLTPAFGRIIQISHRSSVGIKATLTMIAILRYKADIGRYPQDLNQLITAGYLKQLPIDSFSDRPLVYKQTGDGFILYSFGPDCTDDGGEPGCNRKGKPVLWADEGDAVFWPILD